MAGKANIRDLVGLNQHELAALLNVGRSQFSLYELGKRGIPVASTQLLTELLTHVQTPVRNNRTLPKSEHQQFKLRSYLERLLAENDFQRIVVQKELIAAKANHDKQLRVLQVAEFLDNNPQYKNAMNSVMTQSIERRAKKAIEAKH